MNSSDRAVENGANPERHGQPDQPGGPGEEQVWPMDNPEIRMKARATLRGMWWRALGARVLAYLPYVALYGLMVYLVLFVFRMYMVSPYAFLPTLTPGGMLLLILPNMLIAPVLSLGGNRYALALAKGERPTVRTFFFFFGHRPVRAVGLMWAVALKLILWALPGCAMWLSGFAPSSSLRPLLWLGMLVIVALTAPAVFRYLLIPFRLAEDPECSVGRAVREGIGLMAHSKWKLFCLMFSTVGWGIVAAAVARTACAQAGASRAVTLAVALGLGLLMTLLTVYWEVSSAVFYVSQKRGLRKDD